MPSRPRETSYWEIVYESREGIPENEMTDLERELGLEEWLVESVGVQSTVIQAYTREDALLMFRKNPLGFEGAVPIGGYPDMDEIRRMPDDPGVIRILEVKPHPFERGERMDFLTVRASGR